MTWTVNCVSLTLHSTEAVVNMLMLIRAGWEGLDGESIGLMIRIERSRGGCCWKQIQCDKQKAEKESR